MSKMNPLTLLVILGVIYLLKMYARKMMREEEYGGSHTCSCGKW